MIKSLQNDVEDCHRAISTILQWQGTLQFDQSRVALIGHSYGGFIATHLAIKYPTIYKVVVLTNPIADLAAMASTSSVPDWVWQMLGENFTDSSVASDIYIDAWNR